MKTKKLLSVALVSALLAACSSSGGGGGNGIRSNGLSSLNSVPTQYQKVVSEEKTVSLASLAESGTTLVLDGKTTEKYNFSDLPNGRIDLPMSISYQTAQGNAETVTGTMLVYQQPYSVVTGETFTQDSGAQYVIDTFFSGARLGFFTPTTAITTLINQNAIFDYKGAAFDGQEQGTLNYTMDFGTRKGSGSITGFTRTGLIELLPSNLFINAERNGITQFNNLVGGPARLEKSPSSDPDAKYELSFFGPNAEELAGKLEGSGMQSFLDKSEIIFAGKR